MSLLTIQAPAKINLHLAIGSARADGFHRIESIFLALALGDTLRFEPLPARGALEIAMKPSVPVPIEKNIIFKAVSLFRAATGFERGLRIQADKRIPLGAGLGGGSSDAAAALLALNALAGGKSAAPLDQAALEALGASLGSDVPFFLNLANSAAAWVTGRGEKISPVPFPREKWFVLVFPGFSSETAAAYRLLDQFRAKGADAVSAQPAAPRKKALLDALFDEPRRWPFANDFLPAFLDGGEHSGAYRNVLAGLDSAGAEFSGLSGSGSTCFGVFNDKISAENAKKHLLKAWNRVKVTFPLAHGSPVIVQ